jgi:hypothetical protein
VPRVHGGTLIDAVIADLLAVDPELNAKGPEVLRKRREKQPAASG